MENVGNLHALFTSPLGGAPHALHIAIASRVPGSQVVTATQWGSCSVEGSHYAGYEGWDMYLHGVLGEQRPGLPTAPSQTWMGTVSTP